MLNTIKLVKEIKNLFERELEKELNLTWVPAPLVYSTKSGLNDYLNNDTPVQFKTKYYSDQQFEVLQSIAKWKRVVLKKYGFNMGEGLYSDFTSLRPNESVGFMHSMCIDQWGWEVVLSPEERNIDTLKKYVSKVFNVYCNTQKNILNYDSSLIKVIPDELKFITAEELLNMYPNLNSQQRNDKICKLHKAVFIIGIGNKLSNGQPHEGRAPDYDDWNLNGDLLFWNPIVNKSFEVTSMGIRVDAGALIKQLGPEKITPYHELILNNKIPLSIGGGIGRSRTNMLLLNKKHIGEVQVLPVYDVFSDSLLQLL